MNASSPVPADHPLMVAWNAHKATEAFANSKRWAADANHAEGSLWALFLAGWEAANGDRNYFAETALKAAPVAPWGEVRKGLETIGIYSLKFNYRLANFTQGSHLPEGALLYAAPVSAPPGWKLVPTKATPEMERAADDFATATADRPKGFWWWGRLFEAMLAASPNPQVAPEAREP